MFFKKTAPPLLATLQCLAFTPEPGQSYVTVQHHGGRLGDHIIMNLQALYTARKLGIPYLLWPASKKPYLYAELDRLVISTCGEHLSLFRNEEKLFKRHVVIRSLPKKVTPDTLYLVPYGGGIPKIGKSEARKLLAPLEPLQQVEVPLGHISVAIHIRTGGGRGIGKRTFMDNPVNQRKFPHKFISRLGYNHYMRGLKKVRSLFPEQKLYIHLFTDDLRPEQLVEKLKVALPEENLCWGWRKEGNFHEHNVIEDFHDMARFDCLIRPDSNMSGMAEYIGSHCIVIGPCGAKVSSQRCQALKQRLAEKTIPQPPAS